MLDILITFKTCLGLTLLTGLITGLLYTWARARELYLPEVRSLTDEIILAEEDVKKLEEDHTALEEKIHNETDQIATCNNEISDMEAKIHETQKRVNALDAQTEEIRHTYASAHSMLSTQRQRRDQLEKEIGGRSVTTLLEEEERQQQQLQENEKEISHERGKLDEIITRSRRIEAQMNEHKAHRDRTAEAFASIEASLREKEAILETLESDLEKEIETLKNESAKWLEKAEYYKKELLRLKENQ